MLHDTFLGRGIHVVNGGGDEDRPALPPAQRTLLQAAGHPVPPRLQTTQADQHLANLSAHTILDSLNVIRFYFGAIYADRMLNRAKVIEQKEHPIKSVRTVRSNDPFYIVTYYYIKWITTSWADSIRTLWAFFVDDHLD